MALSARIIGRPRALFWLMPYYCCVGKQGDHSVFRCGGTLEMSHEPHP